MPNLCILNSSKNPLKIFLFLIFLINSKIWTKFQDVLSIFICEFFKKNLQEFWTNSCINISFPSNTILYFMGAPQVSLLQHDSDCREIQIFPSIREKSAYVWALTSFWWQRHSSFHNIREKITHDGLVISFWFTSGEIFHGLVSLNS